MVSKGGGLPWKASLEKSSILKAWPMKIQRSRHFWLILVVFALCSLLHYVEQMGIEGTTVPSLHFGLTRHALDRILFLLPII